MSTGTTRRGFLAGAVALGGATVGLSVDGFTLALPPAGAQTPDGAGSGSAGSLVRPDDPRYPDLVRAWNGRFVGRPDYLRVVSTAAEVERALAEAVSAGKRVVARSGGHCLEDFVANPEVKVVIDMSPMTSVHYDSQRNAIVVEPGATLRHVFKTMYHRWGVTVPGGTCPSVGAGGHFVGGGYGPLARRMGIVPDHLFAVEVVTVDSTGTPRTVVATNRRDDPNRELWWAHTGGGGGNFGIVTRYWMRSPNATGRDPAGLLPKPPRQVRLTRYAFPWAALNEAAFGRLLRGFITWYEHNSAPGSPAARLNAEFFGFHSGTSPVMFVQAYTDPTESDADALLAGFRSGVVDPVGVAPAVTERTVPWLTSTNVLGYGDTGDLVGRRNKSKGSYVRRSYTDAQIATSYRYLTGTDLRAPFAGLLMGGFGGQANAVDPDATATPQRDSVLKVLHSVHWDNPAEDAKHLSWVRDFYRDVHADTGGVPTLDGITDGSYINYCDVDLADPAWNRSGVPWHDLYYKHSYPRLQEVKARWDPGNVFRHALSVQLPG